MSSDVKKYEGYALITGGSSGIGLEFAKQLAVQGYDLVLVARNQEQLESAAHHLKNEYSIDVITIAQDLAEPNAAENIFKIAKAKKINVGLLINNAGGSMMGYFHELTRNQNLHMLNVMCLSITDLTHQFLPSMLEKGSGGVIFISSMAIKIPLPLDSVYGAAKAYAFEFGTSLHAEYSNKGIDILTVCPGFVATDLLQKGNHPLPNIPFLTPKEVVSKSLDALGKEVTLKIVNHDFKSKLLFNIVRVLPDKIIEKLVMKFYKDEFHVNL